MTYTEKKYIMDEDNNIIQVRSKIIILFLFFLYMSNDSEYKTLSAWILMQRQPAEAL